jgi:hypothetical protein
MSNQTHQAFSISDVAHGLEKVKWQNPRKFTACCPAHDDHNPSFSAEEDDGKVLVYCHAGCSQDEVISALKSRGNWPDYLPSSPKKISLDEIWKYQMLIATELARHEQGIHHSEEEIKQIEATVRFLESQGYE